MLTLYDYELSGSCYKIRLLLNILGVGYTRQEVDFYPTAEHKGAELLELNPLGQLPVLDDDGFVLHDSLAILSYLARKYAPGTHWYPTDDAAALGQTNMWLAFAHELNHTASAARMHQLFGYELDVVAARRGAYELFRILDDRLWFSEREHGGWLCDATEPTIADISCFPYLALCDEGDMRLVDFPAARRWIDRVKRIPRFIVMSGVFKTSDAPVKHVTRYPATDLTEFSEKANLVATER